MKRQFLHFLVLALCLPLLACQGKPNSQTSDDSPSIIEEVLPTESNEENSEDFLDSEMNASESSEESSKAYDGGLPLIGLPEYSVYVMDWTYDSGIIGASNSGIPIYPYWSDKDRVLNDVPKQATVEYNNQTFQYDHTNFDYTNYYHVDVYRSTSSIQTLEIERESGYIISGGISDNTSERPDKYPDKVFSVSSPIIPSYLRGGFSWELETSLSPYVKDLTSDALLSALQITLENCFEAYTVHLWTEPNEDNPGIFPECVLTPDQSIGILYPCELENEYRSFLFVIVVPSDPSPLFTMDDLLQSSLNANIYYPNTALSEDSAVPGYIPIETIISELEDKSESEDIVDQRDMAFWEQNDYLRQSRADVFHVIAFKDTSFILILQKFQTIDAIEEQLESFVYENGYQFSVQEGSQYYYCIFATDETRSIVLTDMLFSVREGRIY